MDNGPSRGSEREQVSLEFSDEAIRSLQAQFAKYVVNRIAKAKIVYEDAAGNELFYLYVGLVLPGNTITINVPTEMSFKLGGERN